MSVSKAIGRIVGWVLWIPVSFIIPWTKRTRILVVSGNKILLLSGWMSTGKWSLPGGGIHHNERAETAALRELSEEVGIIAKKSQLVSLGSFRQTSGHHFPFHGFLLTLPDEPKLRLQRFEVASVKWSTVKDIHKLSCEQHVELLVTAWQQQR